MKLTLIFLLICNVCIGQKINHKSYTTLTSLPPQYMCYVCGKVYKNLDDSTCTGKYIYDSIPYRNRLIDSAFITLDSMGHIGKGFPEVPVIYIDDFNIPPIALAGTDQIISPNTKTIKLKGLGMDEDGIIVKYHWTQIFGDKVKIEDPNYAETTITGLSGWGIYIFQLEVTDDKGEKGKDNIMVKVKYF